MARYKDSLCRVCRREGLKLFLKGDRCYTDKCAIERRAYAPGQHGLSRSKLSGYGIQLREKQKVRKVYGIMEKQFENYAIKASKKHGVTGETLLQFLERRFDNVVFRLGFTTTRQEARQLVRHGHFKLNGRKVSIPSCLVSVGDSVEVIDKSRKVGKIVESLKGLDRRGIPNWLEIDRDAMKGTVKALPTRADITMPIQESLIVEYYSR